MTATAHRSLWLQEALGDAPDAPPLAGSARADVAIVGGGYVGLWTAILIKEQDPACDVVLLEQDVCGGGASGRNGGFVLGWWPKLATLVAHVAGLGDGHGDHAHRRVGEVTRQCSHIGARVSGRQ